jgi:NAD(P)-dependent dehydrogenase (short-subunit alcohol dehydrogenase family)
VCGSPASSDRDPTCRSKEAIALFDRVDVEPGRVDALINNAGIV